MQTYVRFGKMEITAAQAMKNAKEDKKAADALAKAEFETKKKIIALEKELLVSKIDFMLLNAVAGSKEEENLLNQKRIIGEMSDMRIATAQKEYDLALATNKSALLLDSSRPSNLG